MSRRRKKYTDYREHQDNFHVETTVLELVESNKQYPSGKTKNVFLCVSETQKPRMCVYWGIATFKEGDEVVLKGRLIDEIFLTKTYQITKRGERKNEEKQNEIVS